MLSQQLRQLEADGLIFRTVYPVVPPKTEYGLTEEGRTLIPVLNAMQKWGMRYLVPASEEEPDRNVPSGTLPINNG